MQSLYSNITSMGIPGHRTSMFSSLCEVHGAAQETEGSNKLSGHETWF